MRTFKIVSKIAVLACAACFAASLLASCGTAQQQVDAAQLNREYMSSVNRISNEASEDLATFSQAASQGDLAAMRIAASDASETLGKISDLTAPDALKEVHEEYKAGVTDLSKALEQYVELYSTVANASNGADDADQDSASEGAAAFDEATLATSLARTPRAARLLRPFRTRLTASSRTIARAMPRARMARLPNRTRCPLCSFGHRAPSVRWPFCE